MKILDPERTWESDGSNDDEDEVQLLSGRHVTRYVESQERRYPGWALGTPRRRLDRLEVFPARAHWVCFSWYF